MQLTSTFLDLLQQLTPVFTAPTFTTFVQIVTGWIVSQRHRYVTEVIFSGGNVGKGHWSRFHRFFSHAAWDLDVLSLFIAKLVVRMLTPGATLLWAVDDTLCRKRGLTLYGAGMHHDPLISSRAKPLVSWGHDWVVLCILVVHPWWAPTKVFALPITMRLYRNRQGVTKGKKGKTKSAKPKADPNHRTRPQLAVELITLVSTWFPHDDILVSGDSAYGGNSVLSKLPTNVHLISRVHAKGALYAPAPPRTAKTKGAPRKKGERLPGMAEWAADDTKPWTELSFDQFGLHARLAVKTQQALYYKAGGQRLLTIVLTRDLEGKRPDSMFYCTKLDWDARQILATYAYRWAIECAPGSQSHRSHRHAHRLLDRRLVSSRRPSFPAFPVSPLVPTQARTVLCRHAHDTSARQLRAANPATAPETGASTNLDHPAYRTSQPRRLNAAPRDIHRTKFKSLTDPVTENRGRQGWRNVL
jgi:hypothetical protein